MESLERDLNEETGWKLVHGDVFRPPAHRMLLAACVGTGIQLVMLGLCVILLTIMGTFYEVRGACFSPTKMLRPCICVRGGIAGRSHRGSAFSLSTFAAWVCHMCLLHAA
jgi:hypothetical protein